MAYCDPFQVEAIFEFIPIESQIEKFQEEYYDAIAKCHLDGASTIFIEFMLSQIDKILDDISIQISEDNGQLSEYIKKLLDVMDMIFLIQAIHLWKNWG